MAYSREDLLALRYQGDGIDLSTQGRIRLLGIDNSYDHIPTIVGRRGKVLHHTQSGGNPKNLVNFQCEPSLNHNINVASVNCRSVRNKTNEIVDYVIDNDVDILGLTETWLHEGDSDQKTLGDLTPNGYKLRHLPRSGKKGGGVAVLYKKSLDVKFVNHKASSFECMEAYFTSCDTHIRLLVVYRLIPRNV